MSQDVTAGSPPRWKNSALSAVLSVGVVGGGLATGLLGLLGGCAVVQPPSAAAEGERVMLRMINISPNSPPLSLGIGDNLQLSSVFFGDIGDYVRLPGGRYEIDILASQSSQPLLAADPDLAVPLLTPSESLSRIPVSSFWADLSSEGSFSILAVDEVSRISAIILRDGQRPVFDKALVRFVHAVPDAPPLKWIDLSPSRIQPNGVVIESMTFGSVSNYIELEPGFQSLLLQEATQEPGSLFGSGFPDSLASSSGSSISDSFASSSRPELSRFNFDVRANRVYTVFVTGLLRGSPALDIVLSDETDVTIF